MNHRIYLAVFMLCCAAYKLPVRATAVENSDAEANVSEPNCEMPPADAAMSASNSAVSRPHKNVEWFHGVGVKNGKFDTGFRRNALNMPKKLDEKELSNPTFSPGIQKIIDEADKTIKDFDKATLNTVNVPLKTLGIEAESAKIRPMNDGVGLGISIKLDKEHKTKSQQKEKNEVYEMISPHQSNDASPVQSH